VTRWRFVALAAAALAPPYLILALLGSLEMAFGGNPFFIFPSVVAMAIAVVGFRRYRREQRESATRLRTEVQQEFRERFPKPDD
jgi:hypothetical protein